MSPLTLFLARLIGLYALVLAAAMVVQKQAIIEAAAALVRSPPLLLILAILRLAAGLAIVLGHNVWSGGALPVVVTLLGWVVMIRGGLLLLLSPQATVRLFEKFRFEERYYLYVGITLVLGLYLTIAGFARQSP